MAVLSSLHSPFFWVSVVLTLTLAGIALRLFLRCRQLEHLCAQAGQNQTATQPALLNLDSLTFPASIRSLDGTYLCVNTELARILDRRPEAIRGHALNDLDPSSDFDFLFRQLLPTVLKTRAPINMEHTTGHGASRNSYHTTIIPLLHNDGTPYALLLLSRRIDAMTPLLHSIDGNTTLAGLVLEMARSGYWRIPADGSGTSYLSSGLRRAVGLPETPDSKYSFMQDIYPRIASVDPENAEKLRQYLLSPKNGDEPDFHCPHKLQVPNGHIVHARVVARVIPGIGSSPPTIYGLFQDVTETKHFEEALQQESDRLMAMFDSSPIGLAIVVEDRVHIANPYLTNLLGLKAGDDPYKLFYKPVVTAEYIRQRLNNSGGKIIGAEVMARTAEGKEYTLLASYRRIIHEGKEAVLGWVVDVTALKVTEKELIIARDQAQLAVQVKSRFLANISHEIRTPMNAIIGLSYLLLQSPITRKQRDDLEKIEKASRALLQLINDILDVSKVESGKLSLEASEFVINDVLLNLANMLVVESERKGLDMVFRVAQDVPGIVKGDSFRLGQVLLNLTGNAIKFSAEGEVEVRVEVVTRTPLAATLRFSITDQGIGIAEDQLPHLFQPFSQGDASSTRRFGGTGIGLGLSKSLVDAMGGQLFVESALGQGSTFSFEVPFSLEGLCHRQTGMPSTLRGMRALVVDDSSIDRGILGETLQHLHFRTDLVDNGVQAVESLVNACQRGTPYQFVLLDWKMPVMDGFETAQAIMNDPRITTRPHMIMITAHIGGNIFARAEHAGIRRVLLKPVNPSTLLDTVINLAAANADGPQDLIASSEHPNAGIPPGLHVLVTEDNAINQQVMQELLEIAGVQVDLASNGREALELVNSRIYDMVIMDIQMPEMDGLSATMAIRAIPRLENLPIIAMTAHAMPEDREKSYAAGMNEHITKPVDPQELYRVIRQWSDSGGLINATPPLQPLEAPEHLRLAGLDAATALARIGSNVELYTRLLVEFHTRYQFLGKQIDQELTDNNPDAACALLHTFKGICGSLGATQLAHHAGSLEAFLATGKLAGAEVPFRAFSEQLDSLMSSLQNLKMGPAEETPEVLANHEAELCRVMAEVLAFINMQSPEASVPLGSVQGHIASRYPNELDALLAALDIFDFSTAHQCAHDLCKKLGISL